MIVGTEWLVDATGCRAEALRDVAVLRMIFARVIEDLNLRIVGEMHWHKFPQAGGVTGFALLSESHLACHTYPEYGLATINLYCCRSRPEWPWAKELSAALGAQEVTVRALQRRSAIDSLPNLEHSFQLALAKEI
jgi:S-adenosylmethionine decarboxylase